MEPRPKMRPRGEVSSPPDPTPARDGHAGRVEVVCYRIVVTGTVQGVGYRWACAREAERLGVAGWVRNRDDGSVELIAEGAPDPVERLVEWCGRGPRQARVTSTDVAAEDPRGLSGFRVTR